MSEMIERMIAASDAVWERAERADHCPHDDVKRLAMRAALEALREPTESMVEAAHAQQCYWHHDTSELKTEWSDEMRQEYRAMIDAALES